MIMRRMQIPNEIVEKRIKPGVRIEDWVDPMPGEPRWSTNQLIGAYEAGISEGVKKAIVALEEWSAAIEVENITKAGDHTQQVLDILHRRGMHPKSAILNSTKFDNLRVLILLPLEEYVGEMFEGIYLEVGKRELEWEEATYAIEFMFTSFDDNLNEGLLRADGFILHHTSLRK